MAVRPVFMSCDQPPYYKKCDIEFTYNSGFSASQKQKNIRAIHSTFRQHFKDKSILEISSKSFQEGGKEMSAFFLQKEVPSLGTSLPVENIFQSGKVFEYGGPYLDLMQVTPREAKRDERLRNSGSLIKYTFENQDFPIKPRTIFYDYIYINALLENPDIAGIAVSYDAFTDIEFNPQKSLNCQARSAAIFVSLAKARLLDEVRNFEHFQKLFVKNTSPAGFQTPLPQSREQAPEKPKGHTFRVSEIIKHKKWGRGKITAVSTDTLKVEFSVGVKELSSVWAEKNCEYDGSSQEQ